MLGDLNLDLIVRPDRIGEKATIKELGTFLGGQAANQVFAAKRLGANAKLYTKIGNDLFGVVLEGMLKKEGIEAGIFKGNGVPTGTAILFIDQDGRSPVSCAVSGGHVHMTGGEIDSIKLDGSEVVVSELLMPDKQLLRFFRRARARGCTIILNCSPVRKCGRAIMSIPDYLVMNDFEFSYFAGLKDGTPIDEPEVRMFSSRVIGRGQTLIVTLGDRGVFAVNGKARVRIPGHRVRAIDTIGAGDCFIGAFAAAMSKGQSLDKALRFANAAAAVSVQRRGASASMPYMKDVVRQLGTA